MRIHLMSDLHLEGQEFPWTLPSGDVLVIAGDLCNASAFTAKPADLYMERQRERVRRFADTAARRFRHVVMVAGNHEHFGGVFEETVPLLRENLPGFTVLDDETIAVGGVTFFGATLWTGFEGGRQDLMEAARRGMGEYFFVKTRELGTDKRPGAAGNGAAPRKLKPADTLAAHHRSLAALEAAAAAAGGGPFVVVTHHAPSRHGLNPRFRGGALDCAYGSDLEQQVGSMALSGCRLWIHGHTHIRHRYRMGSIDVHVNCRGFDERERQARAFDPKVAVDL